MKVRIIKTPKLQNGGGIYDNYQPSFTDDLAIGKSIGDFVGGVNQAFNYKPGNFVNKELNQTGNWIGRQFTKTPHASSNTVSPINTTPTLNNTPTTLNSNSLESGNDLLLQGLQNGGLLPNVINKPLMKDGGHTFLTSQPAYTKKSYTYFGTSNAPARDSYTDNNEVNTTVKPVPEEISNIEAEAGEFIYSDQGLYKILGDKHKDGGTPLIAKGGEFIFSDHEDMCISVELQEEAKLKTSPSKKCKDNTPAKILERNVDTKEYNRLKTILQNPKSDNITKKTAQFMLDKMDAKIKTIAQLQEAKKNPQPTEVENSYLEQPEIQQAVDQQKQFQDGGFYQNGVSGVTIKPPYITYPQGYGNQQQGEDYTKFWAPAKTIKEAQQFQAQDQGDLLDAMYSNGIFPLTNHHIDLYNQSTGSKIPYNPTKDQLAQIQDYANKNKDFYINGHQDNQWGIRGGIHFSRPEFTEQGDQAYNDFSKNLQSINSRTGNQYLVNMDPSKGRIDAYQPKFAQRHQDDLDFATNTTSPKFIPTQDPQLTPNKSFELPKQYTKDISDLDISNPYDKVKALQTGELMTDLMSNKPYFTYAAPEIQPWTVATKQSDQPLINQADKSLYIASQVASKLGSNTAMQQTLAKHAETINDALAKIGNVNAQAETANYNNNLTRNASLANRWSDKLKQTYDQNTNVLDKTNFANASYLNKYSEAQQRDMLNKYYGQRDLLTAELPYASQYEEKNPNGTYTRHTTVPINPRTGKFNPKASLWNTTAVNQMSQKQATIEQRASDLKSKGLSDKMIEIILDKEYPDLKQNSR